MLDQTSLARQAQRLDETISHEQDKRPLMSVDEALAAASALAPPPRIEAVRLDEADGRLLAGPVRARRSSPANAVSAMDGYAVRDADLERGPARLRIVGRSFAGAGFHGAIAPGECVRVFTGARVPANADRVLMQEDVRAQEGFIDAPARAAGKRHIRAAGSDFAHGDLLVQAGVRLTPQALIAVAAADAAAVSAFARPRVSLIATGDELAPPGEADARGDAVPESVTPGVAALARRWGAQLLRRELVADQLEALQAAGEAALADSDVVVVVGGASVGERDFSKAMFARTGLEIVVPKVAMRPGKPIWLGRAGQCAVVGLPGNPSAAFVTARLFLAPLIAAAGGGAAAEALRWRRAEAAVDFPAGDERETFVKARLMPAGVAPCDNQDSSAQGPLAVCDVLVRRRAGAAAVRAGERVEALDL